MEISGYMLEVLANPVLIALVAAGTFAGVYIGAIPGLSGTMAISLLVSLSFGWPTHHALALMTGVFVGVVYGASRPAILLNIPGGPSAIATAFDGYPLAKKGLAGLAMGITALQSFFGTILGIIGLAALAPLVSKIALQFRSIDFLMLAFMGLMMAGLGSKGSIRKSIISGAIGLVLGCVGIDPQSAIRRFTFDFVYLNSGVDYIVAMIGLFGASEAFFQLTELKIRPVKQDVKKIIPAWRETLKYLPVTIQSALIGFWIGVMPGAGGDIAALLSYETTKRTVRKPKVPFGEGALEGIIAPETANNAAIGGVFVPMLCLGIPGDAITAVMISALSIHGLQVGPNLMNTTPDLFWVIVTMLCLGALFLLVFGLTGIKIFTKLIEIPKGILLPIILILSVIGSFAIRSNLFDILWMFGFGIFGFFLKRFNFPVSPVVLGIILCNLFETNYRRAIMLEGSVPLMFASIFKSPISIVLFLIIVLLMVSQTKLFKKTVSLD